MKQPDDPKLVYMLEANATSQRGECIAFHNYYWAVHPTLGLVFYQPSPKNKGDLRSASPQCNLTESVAQSLIARLYPWAEVKLIPLVLKPINPQDYC